jgi:AraC-like DNA-binding protein
MLTLPERWTPNCVREPRLPFLRLPGRSLEFRDSVAVAEQLARLLPVRSCDPVRAATPSEPFRWHMGGLQLGPLAIVARAPLVLAVDEPSRRALCERLYATLTFLHGVVRHRGGVPEPLRLDDLLLRQIVDLLAAGLLAESTPPDPPESDAAIDTLLDWMHAHCHEPISLTELEQRARYSRRHLQYAFKARFGCGPMQYLRRQRLWQARRRIEQAGPSSTVSGIALASGYLSLASFRRDFQNRFGITPSALLARRRG